jgi:hypothetical protein
MRVKFIQDFQGVETGEVFYHNGQEVDLPDNQADRLLRDKRVGLLRPEEPKAEEPQPEPAAEPASEPVQTKSPETPKRARRATK